MSVARLAHVNIRSKDVEASKAFYVSILGLTVGPRPPFASVGYWMYLDNEPVVHLVQRPGGDPPRTDSGCVDHIAFRGTNLEATRAALRQAGLAFKEVIVPHDGTIQVFVHDPDGVKIELNFAP